MHTFDMRVTTTTTEKSFFISIGGFEAEWFPNARDAANWIISFYGKSQDKFLEIFNFLTDLVGKYFDPDLALTIKKY